ncbi:MAG: hypothetical protein QG672_1319, partial [Pseudomonadota bacterium]|nr:hypothetical protein [Pseudomonadota bacterium]
VGWRRKLSVNPSCAPVGLAFKVLAVTGGAFCLVDVFAFH